MVIDTTSREGMESALAHLMGVSVPELYQYIEAAADSAVEGQWCFNQDLFDEAMFDELKDCEDYDKESFDSKATLLLNHFMDMSIQGYGWIVA